MKLYPGHHRKTRHGFALLITITLVAFLVLVLVALATLTRVETQIASNSQQHNQARQNALMALNIALGELQRYAGPDQRVTTTADLIADKDKSGNPPQERHANVSITAPQDILPISATASGTGYVPHVTVRSGARYWTGVWGNSRTASYALRPDSVEFSPVNRGGLLPELLGWLVSGNEQHTFPVDSDGSINIDSPLTSPRFAPTLTVGGLSTSSQPTDTNLSFPLADPAITGSSTTRGVLLVGPGSVRGNSTPSATELEDLVVAPTVAITIPGNTVPGLGATATPVEVGRYAWWIGDEGVKARINLQNGYQQLPSTDQPAAQINSFISSQRSAIEFMDGTDGALIKDAYNFKSTGVPNIMSLSQLGNLDATLNDPTRLAPVAKARFHDITTHSLGVLADTYAGGLKKDITADIADTSVGGSGGRPADTDPIFQPLAADPGTKIPTWEDLRAWPRLHPSTLGSGIDATSEAAVAAGVFPAIAHLQMKMTRFLKLTFAAPPASPSEITGVQPCLGFYPVLFLHNPYSVPINAASFDVGIHFGISGKMILEADNGGDKNFVHLADINLNTRSIVVAGSAPGSEKFLRFRLEIETPLQPGERRAFNLSQDSLRSEYNHASPPVLGRSPADSAYYFVISGPTLTHPNLLNPDSNVRLRALSISTADTDAATSLLFASTSIVLAEEGGLAGTAWDTSLNAQKKWRQAMLDIVPQVECMAPGGTFFTDQGRNNGAAATSLNAGEIDANKISLGDPVKDIEESSVTPVDTGLVIHSLYERSNSGNSLLAGVLMGGGELRFLALSSLRAPLIQATAAENWLPKPNGTARAITEKIGTLNTGASIPGDIPDQTGKRSSIPTKFGSSAFGPQDLSAGAGNDPYYKQTAILWDVLASPNHFLSLGQLQHAGFSSYGFLPSYAFGNSYADMHTLRNATYRDAMVARPEDPAVDPAGKTRAPLYDLSWHLNRALWDRYFVSGVPSGTDADGNNIDWTQADITAGKPLPNARMTYYHRDGQAPDIADLRYDGSGTNNAYNRAAANLLVAGSFNINSTSEQAWRAVLAGTSGLPQNDDYAAGPTGSGDMVDTAIPYPRFSRNLATAAIGSYEARPVTMRPEIATSIELRRTLFHGNRGLWLNRSDIPENADPDAVVAELARSIVKEIRRRGPFLSLADFINRPLTPSPTNATQLTDARYLAGIKGALQAGLDNMDPTKAQVNPWFYAEKLGGSLSYPNGSYSEWTQPTNAQHQHAVGGHSTTYAGVGQPTANPAYAWMRFYTYQSRHAMSPKFLTQADLLSTLGPALSARSDTFTIRTYGESKNPVTGTTDSRAWCEAVVQRLPDYVGGEAPETAPAALTTGSPSITFGRTFRIISFRWLSPSEI